MHEDHGREADYVGPVGAAPHSPVAHERSDDKRSTIPAAIDAPMSAMLASASGVAAKALTFRY